MGKYPPKLKKVLEKKGKLPTKSLKERKKESKKALCKMKKLLNEEEKRELKKYLEDNEGGISRYVIR